MTEQAEKFIELNKQLVTTGEAFLRVTDELNAFMTEVDNSPEKEAVKKEILTHPEREELINKTDEIYYKLNKL